MPVRLRAASDMIRWTTRALRVLSDHNSPPVTYHIEGQQGCRPRWSKLVTIANETVEVSSQNCPPIQNNSQAYCPGAIRATLGNTIHFFRPLEFNDPQTFQRETELFAKLRELNVYFSQAGHDWPERLLPSSLRLRVSSDTSLDYFELICRTEARLAGLREDVVENSSLTLSATEAPGGEHFDNNIIYVDGDLEKVLNRGNKPNLTLTAQFDSDAGIYAQYSG